jgi:hypothetical protein
MCHEMCATAEIWEACWHVSRPELNARSRDVNKVTEVCICAIEFNVKSPLTSQLHAFKITRAHVTCGWCVPGLSVCMNVNFMQQIPLKGANQSNSPRCTKLGLLLASQLKLLQRLFTSCFLTETLYIFLHRLVGTCSSLIFLLVWLPN